MLLKYLPKFMQDIEEIQKIMETSEIELENINLNLGEILKDLFIIGASEKGIKHYEKMLGIAPKLTDSLEKRQYDILSIYNRVLPFTYETLIEKLNMICGEKGYIINIFYDKFLLNVKLKLYKKDLYTTVANMLEEIVPVNISLRIDIDYNVWKKLNNISWQEASNCSWRDIKERDFENRLKA